MLFTKENKYRNYRKCRRHYNRENFTKQFDAWRVLFMVQTKRLKRRRESVHQVEG